MKIIYVYDALCGWCYGFSPVIRKAWKKYKDEMEFTVLSGGMMLGDRAGLMRDVAPYVKTAYKNVEDMTGIKFGQGFHDNLLNGEERISSLEPAIAMCIFKEQKPDEAIVYATALQKAINYDGMGPTKLETYAKLAVDFSLDEKDFLEKMQMPEYRQKAEEEFKLVQDWGISGYPTVLGEKGGEYYLLARGYTAFEKLDFALKSLKEFEQEADAGNRS